MPELSFVNRSVALMRLTILLWLVIVALVR
jgi:hypothetical protein